MWENPTLQEVCKELKVAQQMVKISKYKYLNHLEVKNQHRINQGQWKELKFNLEKTFEVTRHFCVALKPMKFVLLYPISQHIFMQVLA